MSSTSLINPNGIDFNSINGSIKGHFVPTTTLGYLEQTALNDLTTVASYVSSYVVPVASYAASLAPFAATTFTWVSLKNYLTKLVSANAVISKTSIAGLTPAGVTVALGLGELGLSTLSCWYSGDEECSSDISFNDQKVLSKATGLGIKEGITEIGKLVTIPLMVSYGMPGLAAIFVTDSIARGLGYVAENYIADKKITSDGLVEKMVILPFISTGAKVASEKFGAKKIFSPEMVTTINKTGTKATNEAIKPQVKQGLDSIKHTFDNTETVVKDENKSIEGSVYEPFNSTGLACDTDTLTLIGKSEYGSHEQALSYLFC